MSRLRKREPSERFAIDEAGTRVAYYDSKKPQIFHVCENCPTGKAIAQADRKDDPPATATRCAECNALKVTQRCTAGN